MFLGITNTPRDYAWGSTTAIGELLGHATSGGPEAELWLGAHRAAPSTVTNASPAHAGERLDALIDRDPAAILGAGGTRLPFLFKVLAADKPLSLQVHPDRAQAQAGFQREEEAGVALDDPTRNYVDDNHKPELILALSPTFEALAGFRHVSEARMLLAELIAYARGDDRDVVSALADRLAAGDPASTGSVGSSSHVVAEGMPASGETIPQHSGGGNPLADTVAWLLHGGDDVDKTVAAVTRLAAQAPDLSSFAREFATVGVLADQFPGDPGVVLSLLLNRISVPQGQALYLEAGVVHAYLEGLGIEVMASSDNVLRGGLTKKHIDVDELLKVVRFEQTPIPKVAAEHPADGVALWRGAADDFVVERVTVGEEGAVHGYRLTGPDEVTLRLTGPAVALCLAGGLTLTGAKGTFSLAKGDAVLITPDEQQVTFAGSADVVLATTP